MTLPGIDISYAQGTTPSLTGLDFVFVRAGYGSNNVDTHWATHSANVRKAGKVLGAYWFWYENQDNALAVSTFLSTAGSADLLALDLEGTGAGSATGHSQATDFIHRVHAAGRKIGLYGSLSGYPSLGQDYNWVAFWNPTPPTIPWTFWQYQGSPLDRDQFNGDAAALAALVGGSQAGTGGLDVLTVQTNDRLPDPNPRPFTIPANTQVNGYDPAQPGIVVKGYHGPNPPSPFGHADASSVVTWPGTPNPPVPHGSGFTHVVDGYFAGLLVPTASITLAPATPSGTPPTKLAAGIYEVD